MSKVFYKDNFCIPTFPLESKLFAWYTPFLDTSSGFIGREPEFLPPGCQNPSVE